MRLAICVPSGDTLHTDMAFSLMTALTYVARERRDISYTLLNEKNSLLEIGRHRLICLALGMKAEAVLFLDSDMIIPKDLISRLCDAGKEVIGCNAIRRYPPHTSCGLNLDDTPISYEQTGIQEVKKLGTGVLLVHTKIFEKIGMPYFKVGYDNDVWTGEDFIFCERVRAAGYKIYCHNDLSKKVYHLGVKSNGYQEV